MNYYLTACGLILHTYFWGAGFALLGLPARWRRFWWMFAPGLGWALQSAVVWAGAHTALAGTDAYGWASEVLPAALLVTAAWRHGRGGRILAGWRAAAGVAALGLAAGWMLLSPMTAASRSLTSTSLGSCDHADYAAGARVFKEFSRDDRTGFLGLPEVTRVLSAETFFEYFVRQNHFTPAALLAHNGTILGLDGPQSVSLTAAVIALLNLPVLVFLARSLAGLRHGRLAAVAAVFAFSPLGAYSVHQAALGQLLAAQGIALLTLVAWGAGRPGGRNGSARDFVPLVLAGFWLLAGSYNFILTVALAPAAAWLVLDFWRRRDGAATLRAATALALGLTLAAVFFWERFAGIAERFALFDRYDFGWVIPLLGPEGWLGIVRNPQLDAWPVPVRAALALALVGLGMGGATILWRRRRERLLIVVALVLPVLAGWAVVAGEARTRPNASYDAFKLLMVFYPGLLAGLFALVTEAGGRWTAGAVATLLVGLNLYAADGIRRVMADPPLIVGKELLALRQIESDARIDSLNMRVEDFWSRLWSNALLLRKPQYFATHTYESRLNTPLRGGWDLRDGILRIVPPGADRYRPINDRFYLTAARPGVEIRFGDGWHPGERLGPTHWRWSAGEARLVIANESAETVWGVLELTLRAAEPRTVALRVGTVEIGAWPVGLAVATVSTGAVALPPGTTELVIGSPSPPTGIAGDARPLGVALYRALVRLGPDGTGQPVSSETR